MNAHATAPSVRPTADELALLRESVRDAVGARASQTPDEQWPQSWVDDWNRLAELGLWSTIEGADGSLTAAAVVVEELGRALYPGPVCEALVGAYLLERLPPAETLPVVHGSPVAAFVTQAGPSVPSRPDTLMFVLDAADELVATTAAQVEWTDAPTLDVTRRIAELHSVGTQTTPVPADDALPAAARAARALLYCADTLGCIEHVLARAAEYASQRTTFGVPIGKYQAVAHRLVDHAVAVRQIRLLVDGAVRAFDEGAHDLALRVATAETLCHGRSSEIISDCIQLAGAIGFTWEFGHHFYLRRVVANAALGGGPERPAQRLARVASW